MRRPAIRPTHFPRLHQNSRANFPNSPCLLRISSSRAIEFDLQPLMPFVAKENPKVTSERVAAVCEALGAEHVTLRAVQAQIGGSMRDVAPLVRAWRKSNKTPRQTIRDQLPVLLRMSGELRALATMPDQISELRLEIRSQKLGIERLEASVREIQEMLKQMGK